MSPKPEDLIDSIDSRESFLAFVRALAGDTRLDESRSYAAGTRGWENGTVESFLEAMQAWAADCSSLPSTPTWRDMAQLLLAGKYYE